MEVGGGAGVAPREPRLPAINLHWAKGGGDALGAASDLVGIAGKSQAIDVNVQDRAYEGGEGDDQQMSRQRWQLLQRTVYDSAPWKQVMLTTTAASERARREVDREMCAIHDSKYMGSCIIFVAGSQPSQLHCRALVKVFPGRKQGDTESLASAIYQSYMTVHFVSCMYWAADGVKLETVLSFTTTRADDPQGANAYPPKKDQSHELFATKIVMVGSRYKKRRVGQNPALVSLRL
ncbi:uncharacterized protein BBA_00654 [Beauveria bassiana ARSEF 2860]|uniref:Uncharacterized protein n=1 Tax=Beauveria bassiana (strain ARSEF 2860) TaxID=655819 RepID=J4KRI7_BEAB2|nr:uncharacterized protein BBA_00654 [Beauveria bassiana ARSEF 2860]EJP71024.1 hypothetical protein BBA_00654 [Beauveria bassiana ARSEF 2860]